MEWMRIQDYIFPSDKILYIHTGELQDKFLIFLKFINEDHLHFMYDTKKERDDEFEANWMRL